MLNLNLIIEKYSSDLEKYVVNLRRQFHTYPELSWCEYITTHRVVAELTKLGWLVRYGAEILDLNYRFGLPDSRTFAIAEERALAFGVPNDFLNTMVGGATGVVAELDTGKDGPTVAIRLDIDALPIQESQLTDHKPYAQGFSSVHSGIMHACGHDGHCAIGLGVATVLTRAKKMLSGKIILIFQPAEEGCRGAISMVKAGILSKVNHLIGLHIGVKARKTGTIYSSVRGFLATTKFDVKFFGKKAHAGINPEDGRNALLAAATAALEIHSIISPSDKLTRVNVGALIAEGARNIIPSFATMCVETRGTNSNIEHNAYKHAKRSIHIAAKKYQVRYELISMGKAPSATCDQELAQVIQSAASQTIEIFQIFPELESYDASDDFTIMMNQVQKQGGQACYICLGSHLANGHHNPQFDFDEKSLLIGVKLLVRSVALLAKK